jgi:hypothetical protein
LQEFLRVFKSGKMEHAMRQPTQQRDAMCGALETDHCAMSLHDQRAIIFQKFSSSYLPRASLMNYANSEMKICDVRNQHILSNFQGMRETIIYWRRSYHTMIFDANKCFNLNSYINNTSQMKSFLTQTNENWFPNSLISDDVWLEITWNRKFPCKPSWTLIGEGDMTTSRLEHSFVRDQYRQLISYWMRNQLFWNDGGK